MELLLKYAQHKESGGARTPHQLKQVIDLLDYVVEQFNNKIHSDKHNKTHTEKEYYFKFLVQYEHFHSILGSITKIVKFFSSKSDEFISSKENKVLIPGLVGFFCRFVSFMKKNTAFVSKSTDEGKTIWKSVSYIINTFKALIEKNKELKYMEDKLLLIEEQLY